MWNDLGAAGLLGLHLPEDYGGGGGGMAEAVVVVEELAAQGARRKRFRRPPGAMSSARTDTPVGRMSKLDV